jgi:predicted transport protein
MLFFKLNNTLYVCFQSRKSNVSIEILEKERELYILENIHLLTLFQLKTLQLYTNISNKGKMCFYQFCEKSFDITMFSTFFKVNIILH